jgi:hypothetical protein
VTDELEDVSLDDEENLPDAPGGEGPPRTGDLVVIPFEAVRERYGCRPEAGLVLEDRRSVVKVLFAGSDRTFWIERTRLRRVPEDRLPLHPLVARLHAIARRLHAEQVEHYDQRGDVGVFHVYARGMSLEDLLAVRDLIGADLEHLRVDPGSMRYARLTLAFRTRA